MIRMVLMLLALAALPGAALAGLTSGTIRHDGLDRSFRLYVPEGLARFPGPRPLVLVLHGGGGSSREVRYATRGRFDALAEENGLLVLYPDAVRRMWDTGSGEMSRGLSARRDDQGFLAALIGWRGRGRHRHRGTRTADVKEDASVPQRPRRRVRPSCSAVLRATVPAQFLHGAEGQLLAS